ncbi:hypothetical protein ACH45F_39580 [Catenuloplanes sp. NPDC020197]|uniref:hypothetical protein n=1 Tax=Catenuloplanes sp. NPDC020197 TaxID=3363958 RepID=UPI0037BBFF9A
MRMSAWRPRGIVVLAVVLFLLATGVTVAGILLLIGAPTASGVWSEIGRWLLQLGTVLAGTGLITAVFRQVDITRARRESWTAILQDLVVGQDAIEGAAMRLVSTPDARTYADLVERCREMRALLRRVIALPEVYNSDGTLRQQIHRMRHYLKPIVKEHELRLLRVSRQESLDKKILEMRIQSLAKNTDRSQSANSEQMFRPMGVSKILRDEDEFPALAAFLRDFDDTEGEFRPQSEIDKAYEDVKVILRRNSGAYRTRRAG